MAEFRYRCSSGKAALTLLQARPGRRFMRNAKSAGSAMLKEENRTQSEQEGRQKRNANVR